jgi:hypothetical protein
MQPVPEAESTTRIATSVYLQVYRCKIKSKPQIRKEIPRENQGWWADVSAGQTLYLRQAVQTDIARCILNEADSKNPEDYMCETFTGGALVAKYAIAVMTQVQNVFASASPENPYGTNP